MLDKPRGVEKISIFVLLCSALLLAQSSSLSPALGKPAGKPAGKAVKTGVKPSACKPSVKPTHTAANAPATPAGAGTSAAAPASGQGTEAATNGDSAKPVTDANSQNQAGTGAATTQANAGDGGSAESGASYDPQKLPAPPAAVELKPGAIHPGPLLKWRQQLSSQINEAERRGVGVANYRVAFDDMEKVLVAGAPETEIRRRIASILTPLHQQMRSGAYLKTFTPIAPPPAIPPLIAPGGEGEKFFVRHVAQQVPVSQLEQAMVGLLNKDRAANGLGSLSFSSQLSNVARQHSTDMCKRNFFAHVNPDGTDPRGRAMQNGLTVPVAENIALVSDRGNPTAMIQQAQVNLMNSPGHRANILSDQYRSVGIGVAFDGFGSLRVTQLFSSADI